MKLTTREMRLVLTALVLIAGAVAFAALVRPMWRLWQENQTRIRQVTAETQRTQQLIEERKELTQRLQTLNRNLLTRLPLARKESAFLSEIGKVAEQANVHILRLNPRGTRDYGPFTELAVELDAEANLGNLVRFLYDIRESSVLLVIDEMRLQPKADRSALLKSSLIISSLFAKE
jgi:Tfp pilus assembly protein PilO